MTITKASIIPTALIVISLLFSNCIDNNLSKSDNLIDKSEFIVLSSDVKSSLKDTAFFKSSKIVFLETTDASLLKSINRICQDDSRLFIFDKSLNKIVIFDFNGRYLANIDRVGGGPSEYQGVMDFCIEPLKKQILVLCHRPYKVMWFTYEGEFIREKKTEVLYTQIAVDSKYIYCTRSELNKTELDNYEIDIFNHELNIINDALLTRDNLTNTSFNRGNQLTSSKNINYARRFDNVIYQIKNGEISKKFVINFKEHAFPKELLNNNYTSSEFYNICSTKKYVFSITNILESDKYLFFNTNIGLHVFDKKTKSLNGYNIIFCSKLRWGSNSYYPVGNSDNKIVSAIEPGLFSRLKERGAIFSPQMLELSQKVKEEDNQVLLIYELK